MHLNGLSVGLGVDSAVEGADLAPGELLDRLAELAHRHVLKVHMRVSRKRAVLVHLDKVALGRRERVWSSTQISMRKTRQANPSLACATCRRAPKLRALAFCVPVIGALTLKAGWAAFTARLTAPAEAAS
jgi:hypothetical protein